MLLLGPVTWLQCTWWLILGQRPEFISTQVDFSYFSWIRVHSTTLLYLVYGGPTFDPVGRCSHVTLMHEKTLLIQRIKSVFFKSESQSKVFSSKSQSKLFSKSESGSKAFFDALTTDQMCFSTRRHFFEEKLGRIKSVFSCISVMWLHESTNFGWIKSWYPV